MLIVSVDILKVYKIVKSCPINPVSLKNMMHNKISKQPIIASKPRFASDKVFLQHEILLDWTSEA